MGLHGLQGTYQLHFDVVQCFMKLAIGFRERVLTLRAAATEVAGIVLVGVLKDASDLRELCSMRASM